MFANDGIMSSSNIGQYENDPNYADYMTKMNGSIARCISRMSTLKKIPCKAVMATAEQDMGFGGNWVIDLNNQKDIYQIARVDSQSKLNIEYENITDTKVQVGASGTYRVLYHPQGQEITAVTGNSTEIELPRNLVSLIPLYVKGDLLEEEEPNLSASARNQFEAMLDAINNLPKQVQRHVRRIV